MSQAADGIGSSRGHGPDTTLRDASIRSFSRRHGRPLGIAGWLLTAVGIAALTWWGLAMIEARLAQQRAREALRTVPPISTIESGPVWRPRGAVLAELSIPRLHMSTMVLHGTDPHTLRLALGHIENTAFPGEPGNVAIAGHRDSFFRPLERVRIGDEIFLEIPQGRLAYRVSSVRVVGATDLSVLAPTSSPALTLVTCYPFWALGHAPDRFVVRASLIDVH
jgi:sortase A